MTGRYGIRARQRPDGPPRDIWWGITQWEITLAEMLTDAGVKVTRQDKADELPAADLVFVDEHSASYSMEEVLASVKKANLADRTIVLTAAINPASRRNWRAGLSSARAL